MSEALTNLVKSASALAHVTENYLCNSEKIAGEANTDFCEKIATTLCDYGLISAEKKADHIETMSKDPAVIADHLTTILGENVKQANEITRLATALDSNKGPVPFGTPEKTAASEPKNSQDAWLENFGALA